MITTTDNNFVNNYYCMTNSLLGNYYPLFLDNSNKMSESVYLCQLSSPELSKNCVPAITLEKIAEITRKSDLSASEKYMNMNSMDILSTALGKKGDAYIEGVALDYFGKIFVGKNETVVYSRGKNNFPGVEMRYDNNIQKNLIVNVRSANRWNNYKFLAGRYVDILYDKNRFFLCKLLSSNNEDTIWLEPQGLYKNSDITLSNPIGGNYLPFLPIFDKKFSGKNKTLAINKEIKFLEWKSFD